MRAIASIGLILGAAAAASCSDNDKMSTSTSTSSSSTGAASTSTASTGAGGAGSTTLALPQLVHGKAYVDQSSQATIPVVVTAVGDAPDKVEVAVGSDTYEATLDGGRYVAQVDTAKLAGPTAPITATSTRNGQASGTVTGSLVVANGSYQFTTFRADGESYSDSITYDAQSDAFDYAWISIVGSKHQLSLNHLDGAFQRIDASDIVLNDPNDEPLSAAVSKHADTLGVVYRAVKPADSHWSVKLRVVGEDGSVKVPTQDLTGSGAAFSEVAGAADPGGYSASWLHITPPTDPNNPRPLEVRFARWDTAKGELLGPLTIDSDQPQANGSQDGPQTLEPIAEMGIACNSTVCLVTYTRDSYNAVVDLNIPKLFVGVVDTASGALVGPPSAVEIADWDTQMFGHQIITNADQTFTLVYTANDTKAAVTPKDPCDETLERDLLFAVTFDATGAMVGHPKAIFDNEGTREFPRIATHPRGLAMFWEDQRSECDANGHIRMAANFVAPDLGSLLDPYLELPSSVAVPPEDPSVTVNSTNADVSWSDNRHGMGIVDEKLELFLDTIWSK